MARLTCPHCGQPVQARELRHPGLFKNFRLCPHCGGKLTVDSATKRRQAVCILAALVSLALTLHLFYAGALAPALISYGVLCLLIYRGNRLVRLVAYTDENRPPGDR